MTTRTVLSIQGMSCGHCVRAVDQALRALEGVTGVEVDLSAGRAVVEHDPEKAPVARLVEVVAEEGYEVAPAS